MPISSCTLCFKDFSEMSVSKIVTAMKSKLQGKRRVIPGEDEPQRKRCYRQESDKEADDENNFYDLTLCSEDDNSRMETKDMDPLAAKRAGLKKRYRQCENIVETHEEGIRWKRKRLDNNYIHSSSDESDTESYTGSIDESLIMEMESLDITEELDEIEVELDEEDDYDKQLRLEFLEAIRGRCRRNALCEETEKNWIVDNEGRTLRELRGFLVLKENLMEFGID